MQSASGAAQLNFGLDHLITPLRDMGHIARVMFGGCADNMSRMALLPYGPTAGRARRQLRMSALPARSASTSGRSRS